LVQIIAKFNKKFKTLIDLRHMSDNEFIVEFVHEKTFRDLGSGLNVEEEEKTLF